MKQSYFIGILREQFDPNQEKNSVEYEIENKNLNKFKNILNPIVKDEADFSKKSSTELTTKRVKQSRIPTPLIVPRSLQTVPIVNKNTQRTATKTVNNASEKKLDNKKLDNSMYKNKGIKINFLYQLKS